MRNNSELAMTVGIIGIIAGCIMLGWCSGCAFDSEDPTYQMGDTETQIEYKYLYRPVYVGSCSFLVKLDVEIPANFAHYNEDVHYFGIIYDMKMTEKGILEKGAYNNTNGLETRIACGACTNPKQYPMGYLAVLDDKFRLVPWGWGTQRPPLSGIKKIKATVGVTYNEKEEMTGTTMQADTSGKIADENGNHIGEVKIFSKEFTPEFINGGMLFDDENVVIDLLPACEVLEEAGLIIPERNQ